MHPLSNGLYLIECNNFSSLKSIGFKIGSFSFTLQKACVYFGFLSGVQYCFENIYYGFLAAQDKKKALSLLFSAFHLFILIILSTLSQFYGKNTSIFMLGIGLYFSDITARLNISTISGTKYSIFYIEPYVFKAIMLMDIRRVVSKEVLILLYTILLSWLIMKYWQFMHSIVQ